MALCPSGSLSCVPVALCPSGSLSCVPVALYRLYITVCNGLKSVLDRVLFSVAYGGLLFYHLDLECGISSALNVTYEN